MQLQNRNEALVDALHHPDPAVRLNTAIGLARQGDVVAAPVLLEALDHDNRVVRRSHAAEHLVTLGPAIRPQLEEVINNAGRGRAVAAHVLGRIDRSSVGSLVPVLVEALTAADPETRRDAIWAIERVGPAARDAVPALVERLEDAAELPDLRATTAEALAAVGEPAEVIAPVLAAALRLHQAPSGWWSGTRPIGCSVAAALARMGSPASPAVPSLVDALGDQQERFDIRTGAARALGAIGEPLETVLVALQYAADDPDWWVRVAAIQSLGALGERARVALPTLAEALGDRQESVRRQAIRAMTMLGDHEPVIPHLVDLLSDGSVAGLAAEALARLGEPAVLALAAEVARRDDRAGAYAAYALGRIEANSAWSVPLAGVTAYSPSRAEFHLTGPRIAIDPSKRRAFEALVGRAQEAGAGSLAAYALPYPKYEFLHYLVEERGFLVHGSNLPDLTVLAPIRWSTDPGQAGNLSGIYACADGIWSMYYAVADRTIVGGLRNGAHSAETPSGRRTFYHFAFDEAALRKQPWTAGTVYVLPRESFADHHGQWVSRAPVQPILRVAITPDDFPFRQQTRGCVPADGWPGDRFPWLDDARIYMITPNGYHAACRRLAGLDPAT